MTETRSFFIAGEWTRGQGVPLSVFNPSDGSLLSQVGTATSEDLDQAVNAAQNAMKTPSWCNLNAHQRAKLLYSIGEKIDAEADALAHIQMSDNGKTLTECRGMIASAANTFRYYAGVCETAEDIVTPARGQYRSIAVHEPIGVVGAITPWNSPATLEAQKLAPILAGGNAVILKPSEVTPMMALEFARISEEVGFPKGVVSVIVGAGDLGKAMVEHPKINMISFTGGTVAGRHIASAAGQILKPVVLELGGKSPNIIFADADFDLAIKGAANGIFSGAGESCIAGSRIFVEATIFDEFVNALVKHAEEMKIGAPDAAGTEIGPLIHAAHRDLVHSHVERAITEGATLLTGGKIPDRADLRTGAYYTPTLLTGLSNSAAICQQEVFGPVGVVLPFENEDQLISMTNDSEFGLASGIWTRDLDRAWRIADRLQAGTVWINTYKQLSISTPFEGHKQSGIGREKGSQGMRIYMQTKAVFWANGTR